MVTRAYRSVERVVDRILRVQLWNVILNESDSQFPDMVERGD